jgi:hypothetical protein
VRFRAPYSYLVSSTSFIGTIAAFLIVGIKKKINFKSAFLVAALMGFRAIVGLCM